MDSVIPEKTRTGLNKAKYDEGILPGPIISNLTQFNYSRKNTNP